MIDDNVSETRPPAPPEIELDRVTKRFDGAKALDRVTVRWDPGLTHVVLGPSGSGKSTLVRLLAGLIRPDEGRVRIGSTEVDPGHRAGFSERTGYVVQDGGLFPHLTVRDNASLMARLRGWPRDRVTNRLAELAGLLGLEADELARFPHEVSGGQRQRAGLLRALMMDPPALLLDEPLGALDPIIRSRLQSELRDIFRRFGKTVVFITHDLGEAAYFADTVTLLAAGRVVQHGPFEDLLARPAEPFVTAFVNAQRPPRRLVEGAGHD